MSCRGNPPEDGGLWGFLTQSSRMSAQAITQHLGSMLSVPRCNPTAVLRQPPIGGAECVKMDRTALPLLGDFFRLSLRHMRCSVLIIYAAVVMHAQYEYY